jgi:hypothetical protein
LHCAMRLPNLAPHSSSLPAPLYALRTAARGPRLRSPPWLPRTAAARTLPHAPSFRSPRAWAQPSRPRALSSCSRRSLLGPRRAAPRTEPRACSSRGRPPEPRSIPGPPALWPPAPLLGPVPAPLPLRLLPSRAPPGPLPSPGTVGRRQLCVRAHALGATRGRAACCRGYPSQWRGGR